MTGGGKSGGDDKSPLIHRPLSLEEVTGWFADAVDRTRFRQPPDRAIEQVAYWLSRYRAPDYEPLPPSKAVEHGRRFLNHLQSEYESRIIAPYRGTPLEDQMILIVNNASNAIYDFIDAFGLRFGKETWHDHARWIDMYAVRAWKEGGSRYPRAIKEDSPRVLFAHFVLAAWGIEKDASQVADALRGKYGNQIMAGFELGSFPDAKTTHD